MKNHVLTLDRRSAAGSSNLANVHCFSTVSSDDSLLDDDRSRFGRSFLSASACRAGALSWITRGDDDDDDDVDVDPSAAGAMVRASMDRSRIDDVSARCTTRTTKASRIPKKQYRRTIPEVGDRKEKVEAFTRPPVPCGICLRDASLLLGAAIGRGVVVDAKMPASRDNDASSASSRSRSNGDCDRWDRFDLVLPIVPSVRSIKRHSQLIPLYIVSGESVAASGREVAW
jgi:hypothetical protein